MLDGAEMVLQHPVLQQPLLQSEGRFDVNKKVFFMKMASSPVSG